MFNKTVAMALIGVMTCLSIRAEAQSEADEQARERQNTAAIAKARAQELAAGKRSVVYVKLRDGTEFRGYISQTGNDSFTITDKATNKATSVSYGDVVTLRGKERGGLSTRSKVLIVVGFGVGILVAVVAVVLSHSAAAKV
jgi:hypothetical protein